MARIANAELDGIVERFDSFFVPQDMNLEDGSMHLAKSCDEGGGYGLSAALYN